MGIKYFTILFIIFLPFLLSGQSLGQDTENFSTIVFPSTNVSLNLTESSASFSLYRDSRIKNEKPNNLTDWSTVFDKDSVTVDDYVKELKKLIKNNNNNRDENKNSKYITWGIDFKGESENGVAPIFSSDKIASSSSVSGLIGYRWTNFTYDDKYIESYVEARLNIKKESEILDKIEELIKNKVINSSNKAFLTQFKSIEDVSQKIDNVISVIEEIPKLKSKVPSYPSLDKEVTHLVSLSTSVNAIIKLLNTETIDETNLFKEIKTLQGLVDDKNFESLNKHLGFDSKNLYETKWSSVLLKIRNLYLSKKDRQKNKSAKIVYNGTTELQNLLVLFTDYKKGLLKLKVEDYMSLDELKNDILYYNRFLIYARGGVTGSEFRLDLENEGTTVDTRFQDITFNGYSMDIGGTLQIRELNFYGFSLGYNYTHNLSELEDQTFQLQVIDPNIMSGNFVSVTEVKAMNGDYDKFHRFDINFDYARLFRIKENHNTNEISHLYLSVNPYLRHRIYNNTDVLDNNTVLGLGIHAYNSKDNKIMGGVFVQTPDLFGVHKNDKGLFDEGINFGLIIRYNFKGLTTKTK